METFSFVLQILAIGLLVFGIFNRKKAWGQKLLYFALGMLAVFFLTDGIEGFTKAWNEGFNSR
ncbi:MAG: hypothetical protein AB9834_01310 [Lentimicrobium sp.]